MDLKNPKIQSLYNGFFKLSAKAWHAEQKKVPLQPRSAPLLYNVDETENFIAGEIRNGIVVLDFDNEEEGKFAVSLLKLIVEKEMFEIDLKYNVVQTEKGYHIYFKNPDLIENPRGNIPKKIPQGHICALGLECEYKLGGEQGKNPDYEPIRLDTIDRNFLGEIYSFDELSPLPFFFYYFKKRESIFKMKQGSRNHTLSEFALGLQKLMNRDDVETVCRIINGMIFEEKLSKKEMDAILRDKTFEKATVATGGKADKL
jgi:Bifunctional DNA primase/polymerase, N-terminal.